MSAIPLSERARGRWPEIIGTVLGPEFLSGKHGPCPVDGSGVDRFRFADYEGSGNFFCGCSDGSQGGAQLIMCAKRCSFAEAAKMVESVIGKPEEVPVKIPAAPEWWEAIKPLAVKRSAYLESRGLEMAPALRFAREVPYFDEGRKVRTFDGMFAPILRGDKFITWHLTYLLNGTKANVPAPRKILSAGIRGASVPLYPFAGGELGVAEGIETAIAAHMLYKVPVWSALNAGNMGHFEIPEGISTLHIFGDNDANYCGQAAAYALAHRAVQKNVAAVVYLPEIVGDWNDVLQRERKS